VGRKLTVVVWNAGHGQPRPRPRVVSVVNGGCVPGKDRSWCESVFDRACCCPSCFCQTSPGNPRLSAWLGASARKNHREKCDQIANDGTVRHLRGPLVPSPQRIG